MIDFCFYVRMNIVIYNILLNHLKNTRSFVFILQNIFKKIYIGS